MNIKYSDCLYDNIDNFDLASTKEEVEDLNIIEVQNELDVKCLGIVSL